MPPTPKDLKDFADKNRNNPEIIFGRMINTLVTQLSPHGSYEPTSLRERVAKQILSQHIATQLSNHAPGDIMITGGTSLMLRVPHARITEDIDIITRFYPTKEKLDQLCQSMSQDPNDPFTYTCRFKKPVQSRDGNSFEIDVYLNGELQSTVKMDAVQARGSELGKDGKFNNEAVEKLQVRDPLLTSHRNNKELTTLQLLSPEKYLAGKIAGLFHIHRGELQEVKRWKDLRDIMILATNIPIDADKLNDAFYDLMDDSHGKFIIPKSKHITNLLEQARDNRQFINRGFNRFFQADRLSIEAMVRIMSDLILDYDENTMWDLKAHNPQLQRFEAHKNLPKLSFPELEDLELDGWREKTPADINKPPKILDYETGTFKQASATTPRNTSSHASIPGNKIPQQMVSTTQFGRLGGAVELIEDPVTLESHAGNSPWAQGIIDTDVLRTLAGGQPHTLPIPPTQQEPPGDTQTHNKSERKEGQNSLFADKLIEGGKWNGEGLGNLTTQIPPESPQDNPPANSQDNSNDNKHPHGLST